MNRMSQFVDRWLGRASGLYAFWPLLPPSALAALSIFLSRGVSWIAELGAFGWFLTGLVTFVLSSAGFALIARAGLWKIEAANRARIDGDSSPFDAMARVYENKRLYLRDLAPAGRLQIRNKKFINCEIIGPGSVIIGLHTDINKPSSQLKDCQTFDVDCMEIDANKLSSLAIGFWDCDFDGCSFYYMTMLFSRRYNETLHWMTPDFRQPDLLPDQHEA